MKWLENVLYTPLKKKMTMTNLEKNVDLHVHSNYSDGSLSPSQLVDLAVEKGLFAFALTDHDTIDGIDEAIESAKERPVTVIPGIELSTEYEGKDVHIVGLMIDHKTPAFQKKIQEFVDSRELRNEKMCNALRTRAGMDITYEDLKSHYPDSVITRAHYARYMLEKGYIRSLSEAFERYIGDRAPYFIPREKVTPQDAVSLILSAKGIPVLAHPLLYGMSSERLQILVSSLKSCGLVALEALYATYSPSDEASMRLLAEKNGLLLSGGSDFHGAAKPKLELGTGYGKLQVPKDIFDKLLAKRKELFS